MIDFFIMDINHEMTKLLYNSSKNTKISEVKEFNEFMLNLSFRPFPKSESVNKKLRLKGLT